MKRALIVLISGASSGIGRAAAEHLAKRGRRVFAGVRRPQAGGQSVPRTDRKIG
jgi:NAD(P)-dependent dehydrogenase (short-subunit alcohol dehydrogenase family)